MMSLKSEKVLANESDESYERRQFDYDYGEQEARRRALEVV